MPGGLQDDPIDERRRDLLTQDLPHQALARLARQLLEVKLVDFALGPELWKQVVDLGTGQGINSDLYVSAASSFHPGGANFSFCDGSVRFLKDSIQQPPINPATSLPQNVTVDGNNIFTITAPLSVYQAISTRNGGEVISADAY